MTRGGARLGTGGARPGAGRIRVNFRLSLEGGRNLAKLKKSWGNMSEEEIIEKLIRQSLSAPVQTNDKGTILYAIKAEG